MEEPDPARPSLILRRTGEGGLWELAKACGSTVEAIRSANGLEAEPGGRKAAADPRQLKNRAGGRNPVSGFFRLTAKRKCDTFNRKNGKTGYYDLTNHSLCQFGGTFVHQPDQRGAAAGAVGAGLQKWQEKPNSLIAGSGGFVIFALILEQSVNSIVLNNTAIQETPWLFYLYGGAVAALFEELGRFFMMKVAMRKNLDAPNAVLFTAWAMAASSP